MPKVASLTSVSRSSELVFPARHLSAPDILAFSNAPSELRSAWSPAYAARSGYAEPISLEHLPAGTQVSGSGFEAIIGDVLISEQLNPGLAGSLASLLEAANRQPFEEVDGEVFLVARYGEGTWGHWLVELLPKVAVAERTWPGRFRFAVPGWVFEDGTLRLRLSEAFSAYGVEIDRLVALHSGRTYQFQSLYGLTSVLTNFFFHPDVAGVVEAVVPRSNEGPRRVALLRSDSRRAVANADEVNNYLVQERFRLIDVGLKPFLTQLQIFRSARTIFSVLGSTLSGLIYSPPGTRVIAAAPEQFGDRFFYNLFQAKPGVAWAEARGPVVGDEAQFYRDSAFYLPITVIRAALSALGV
ncbi:MAG: glycosyltransferase family 61 protein [Acidisphaera sp.]|nr:glycosyltransferase family 61 protein [Acidisphaera sp.]